MSKPDDPPAEILDEFAVEAMKRWERWVASVLGVILGGLGAHGRFKIDCEGWVLV